MTIEKNFSLIILSFKNLGGNERMDELLVLTVWRVCVVVENGFRAAF